MTDIKKESIHLYIIQFANYIVPLISLPYLTKVLTLSGMGKLGLAQSLFSIIQAFIDFGFTYTASRNVSINLDDEVEVRKIYTNVQFIRFSIFLSISLIGGCVLFFIDLNYEDKILYFIAIISTFSVLLTPLWIFNGISKNSVISKFLIVFKFITLILLFLLVHAPDDYISAFIILNTSMCFLGFPIYFYLKRMKIYYDFKLLHISIINEYFMKGFNVFVGIGFSMSYTNFIPFFIKYFSSDYWVGVYIVVERLLFILRQMYIPIIQASYAKICVYVEKNLVLEYSNLIRNISLIFFGISFLALIANFFAGEIVIYYLLNNEQIAYQYTFISMLICFVVAISMILTYCYYLARDLGHFLKWIYCIAALIFYTVLWSLAESNKVTLYYIYFNILFVEICIVLMQFGLLIIINNSKKIK